MPEDFHPKQPIASAIERGERAPRFEEPERAKVRTGQHPYSGLEERMSYDRRAARAARDAPISASRRSKRDYRS